MSAIKDVYDLIEKIHETTKDRQILELLLPIKEKILEVEKEHLRLQEKFLTIQREHDNTVSKLKSYNSKLESEINKFKNKQIAQTGFRIDRPHR